jgi:hypothetical protein
MARLVALTWFVRMARLASLARPSLFARLVPARLSSVAAPARCAALLM